MTYDGTLLTETVGDENMFINTFKQRLIDCAVQEWHTEISQSRKGLHYVQAFLMTYDWTLELRLFLWYERSKI